MPGRNLNCPLLIDFYVVHIMVIVSANWGITYKGGFVRSFLTALANKYIWGNSDSDFKLGEEKGIKFRINTLTNRKRKTIQ